MYASCLGSIGTALYYVCTRGSAVRRTLPTLVLRSDCNPISSRVKHVRPTFLRACPSGVDDPELRRGHRLERSVVDFASLSHRYRHGSFYSRELLHFFLVSPFIIHFFLPSLVFFSAPLSIQECSLFLLKNYTVPHGVL